MSVERVDTATWHAAVLIDGARISCIGFRTVRGRDRWMERLRAMVAAVWDTLP